jgi:hypothetical protein
MKRKLNSWANLQEYPLVKTSIIYPLKQAISTCKLKTNRDLGVPSLSSNVPFSVHDFEGVFHFHAQ